MFISFRQIINLQTTIATKIVTFCCYFRPTVSSGNFENEVNEIDLSLHEKILFLVIQAVQEGKLAGRQYGAILHNKELICASWNIRCQHK